VKSRRRKLDLEYGMRFRLNGIVIIMLKNQVGGSGWMFYDMRSSKISLKVCKGAE